MTTTTILLIGVGVVILGVAVFSWWFENTGDSREEQNQDEKDS